MRRLTVDSGSRNILSRIAESPDLFRRLARVKSNEPDRLVSRVMERFPETTYPPSAGFILPDGRLLDFSGRPSSSTWNRSLDHREVNASIHRPRGLHIDSPSQAMRFFEVHTNSIRMGFTADGYLVFSLVEGQHPTDAQRRALERIAAFAEETWPSVVASFDLYSIDGDRLDTLEDVPHRLVAGALHLYSERMSARDNGMEDPSR